MQYASEYAKYLQDDYALHTIRSHPHARNGGAVFYITPYMKIGYMAQLISAM